MTPKADMNLPAALVPSFKVRTDQTELMDDFFDHRSAASPVGARFNFRVRQSGTLGGLQAPDEKIPQTLLLQATDQPLRILDLGHGGSPIFPGYSRLALGRWHAPDAPLAIVAVGCQSGHVESTPPGDSQAAAPRSAALIRVDVADALALPYPSSPSMW